MSTLCTIQTTNNVLHLLFDTVTCCPLCLSRLLVTLSLLMLADFGGYSPTTIGLLTLVIAAAVAASVPAKSYGQPDPADTLPWDWSADNVASYWSRRPVAVARRSVTVTMAALSVGLALLLDRARGQPRCLASQFLSAKKRFTCSLAGQQADFT